jgi:hypothetical protein
LISTWSLIHTKTLFRSTLRMSTYFLQHFNFELKVIYSSSNVARSIIARLIFAQLLRLAKCTEIAHRLVKFRWQFSRSMNLFVIFPGSCACHQDTHQHKANLICCSNSQLSFNLLEALRWSCDLQGFFVASYWTSSFQPTVNISQSGSIVSIGAWSGIAIRCAVIWP